MDAFERKLRNELHKQLQIAAEEEQLENTLFLIRSEYHKRPERKRTSFGKFLLVQVHFAGWKIWLKQALVLLLLYGMVDLVSDGDLAYIGIRHMPFLLSCFGVCILMSSVPLYYRTVRYGMLETVAAAKLSNSNLIMAQLVIAGAGNVVMLAATIVFIILRSNIRTGSIILWVGVSFLVAACFLITSLAHAKIRWLPVLCGIFCCIFISGMAAVNTFYPAVAEQSFNFAWGIFCVVLLALCMGQLQQMKQNVRYMEL